MTESLDAALATARGFFDALSASDHARAAALVAPSHRTVFREYQLAGLASWANKRDAIQAMLSGEGNGAVSWGSDGSYRPEELARVADTPLPVATNVRTLGELAALPPDEFVSLFLDLSTPLSASVDSEIMERTRYRVLGGVLDGADVVHVVYRSEMTYDDPHHVDVLRVLRSEGGWSIDISTAGHNIVNNSWLMMTLDLAPPTFGGGT
ncbi:MAG: hypothetical protein IT353_18455 [Gemmatimonadaceae bacterium]|nr:hypothetical protein [Gemmatimonadaceae bacterium]